PITAGTFIVGWLAIAGVPPFAGFWAKDNVLLYAYDRNKVLWLVGLVTALLTAYYMTRQVMMVFFGEARWEEHRRAPVAPTADTKVAALSERPGAGGVDMPTANAGAADEHGHGAQPPHESPWIMLVPLIVLAILSTIGGLLNLPIDGWRHLE